MPTSPETTSARLLPPDLAVRPIGTDASLLMGAMLLAGVMVLLARLPLVSAVSVGVAGLVYALTAAIVRTYAPTTRQSVFGAANRVTLIRAVLMALVAGLVVELTLDPARPAAIALAASVLSTVAVLLDGLDGWLARRARSASDFGARFDMEVDAALILVLSVGVVATGQAGVWAVLIGAMRYLFVAAGRLWPWLEASLPVSMRRKAVCVIQSAALLAAMLPVMPPAVGGPVLLLALAALFWSFAVDVLWLRRHREIRP